MPFDVKKIKNLFFESVEPETTEKTVSNPKTISAAATPTIPTVTKPEELDREIVDSLVNAIYNNNLPGEDYLEFVEALKALENIPLDEAMKVQTVMATLSTKGLTGAKIIESADYYLKILTNEKSQFLTEMNRQIDTAIKSKEQSIEAQKESINAKTQQIALLTKEINDVQQTIRTTEEQIKAAEVKINAAQESFDKAYQYVSNQINANISRLK